MKKIFFFVKIYDLSKFNTEIEKINSFQVQNNIKILLENLLRFNIIIEAKSIYNQFRKPILIETFDLFGGVSKKNIVKRIIFIIDKKIIIIDKLIRDLN